MTARHNQAVWLLKRPGKEGGDAAGFITVGVYDANGEADQPGLKKAADLYVKCLGEVPITEM